MQESIQELLKNIEVSHNIEILYACESGSRAWGFASPNSDYDIRFLYRHSKEHYLSVFDSKETIEIPIKDDLDPGGWDIRKALGLLGKSNGALIEWLHSPIIYSNKDNFREQWQSLTSDTLNVIHLSNHYLGLANQIRRRKLQAKKPSAKSYLYACRALLSSQWVQQREKAPPVPFASLLELADTDLRSALEGLVTWKADADETASPGRIEIIDHFINNALDSESSWTPKTQIDPEKTRKLIDAEFIRLLNDSCQPPESSTPPIKHKEDFTLDRIRQPDLILLDAIGGSHAYGTATETSDTDYRGVFSAPTDFMLGLNSIEQVSDEKSDQVYYELTRFFHLLEKNNPTALELLFTPEDCIKQKHAAFDLIHPKFFLSKRCEQTFAGYAVAQIKKARGLNKKIVNPQPEQRKHLRDFCYILEGQGSKNLSEWLDENNIHEEDCGLVASRHAPSVYALFHNSSANYRGIFSRKNDAAVLCSSVAKETKPIAWMSCNTDAFKAHCREHREYWDWVSLRNEDRYVTNASHGRGYDSKNMMHTLRLLDMAIEIASEEKLCIKRPNREWLLQVKNGEFEYEDLLNMAEERLEQVKKAYSKSNLPDEPNRNQVIDLLEKTRKVFYA